MDVEKKRNLFEEIIKVLCKKEFDWNLVNICLSEDEKSLMSYDHLHLRGVIDVLNQELSYFEKHINQIKYFNHQFAIYLVRTNFIKEANYYFKNVYRICLIVHGNNAHKETADSLFHLAQNLQQLEDYEKQLEYNIMCYKMRCLLYNYQENKEIADSLNSIGINFLNLNIYKKAIKYLKAGLKIRRNLATTNNKLDIAESLHYLGTAYAKTGMEKQGINYIRESIKIREPFCENINESDQFCINNVILNFSVLGYDQFAVLDSQGKMAFFEMKSSLPFKKISPISLADDYYHIAFNFSSIGNDKFALKYLIKLFQMRQRIHSSGNHIDEVHSLYLIAAHNIRLGNSSIAYQFLKKSYMIRMKLFNNLSCSHHVNYLHYMAIIAGLWKNYDECIRFAKESLEMRRNIYQKSHEEELSSYCLISICYEKLHDYKKSLKYAMKAYDIKIKFDSNNLSLAMIYSHLSIIYEKLKDYEKSLECELKSYSIIKEIFKNYLNSTMIADSFTSLSIIYHRLGNINDSIEYYQESIKIRKWLFNNNYILSYFSLSKMKNPIEYDISSNRSRLFNYVRLFYYHPNKTLEYKI